MHRTTLILIVSICILLGCNQERKPKQLLTKGEEEKAFIRINKALVDQDKKLIEEYIKTHKLDGMKENGSGLYYLVWGKSLGSLAERNNVVEFKYKVSLMDGTVCYQSTENSTKKFKVGEGGVESGLEQAVLLMCPGQSGKFILPPHLAYGLPGDNNKIPPRSIIIYDIEMLAVYR